MFGYMGHSICLCIRKITVDMEIIDRFYVTAAIFVHSMVHVDEIDVHPSSSKEVTNAAQGEVKTAKEMQPES